MNRWTQLNPRASNVIDAEAVAKEVAGSASLANGGLTRDNLPDATITAAMCESKAFHSWALLNNIMMPYTIMTPYTASEGLGVRYQDNANGWIPHTQSLTLVCVDGMLHIEFDCNIIQSTQYVAKTSSWIQFRILVDGVVVNEGEPVYVLHHNYRIIYDNPITTGTHVVSLEWRLNAPEGTETAGERRTYFYGGQLWVLNSYR